jgi:predicted esterase
VTETIYIKTPKTARINLLGKLGVETKYIWIVLHGYGELSPYFIRKFTKIVDTENVVIAPEALSRFYLNGFNGRVGATWMTKEERLQDIEDYLCYLDEVYNRFVENKQVIVVGFSQGAATASRWVSYSEKKFNSLILWCGVFPPDLPMELNKKFNLLKNIIFVNGNADKLVSEEIIEKSTSSLYFNIKKKYFEGGHQILPHTLDEVKTIINF